MSACLPPPDDAPLRAPIKALVRVAACVLALAGLLGAPPAVAQALAAADTMAERTAACTACHGSQGRATQAGYFPRIAGKPAGYLYAQLLNFRDGRRHNALMSPLLAHLTDDYLREMAGYFAAIDLPYPAPQSIDLPAALRSRAETLVRHGDATRGIPACVQCHGAALTGVQPGVPGLLGLPRDYLNAQLGAWRTGQRAAVAPDCMRTIAERLEARDVAALSGWLAGQPVPGGGRPAHALPGRSTAMPMPCGGVAP